MNRRRATNRLASYRPYPKQRQFHDLGAAKRERAFLAGNQLGKTLSAGCEYAMHLTGRYPDWWRGRRYDRPVVLWAGGITSESTRDNPQRILVGRPNDLGTGTIPAADLDVDLLTWRRGVAEALDMVKVKHVSGGTSLLMFKSYDQGREKWQGDTVDGVWLDEEPPADIYSEALTRTNATGGFVMFTATPLLGMTEVVGQFFPEPTTPDRALVQMTIDDVGHYSAEQRAKIVASYLPHEREARTKGIPILGSGRVFPVAEETIAVPSFPIPPHWPVIAGMDFGYDHPFSAVALAWDRDSDCIYVIRAYKEREKTPIHHVAAIKPWGVWIPWAWPGDGLNTEKGTGEATKKGYEVGGLNMLPERATDADGSVSVEATLLEMLERLQTGRLKVFSHLSDWFAEFRQYHRKDGKIVKQFDDLMDATRYALMMIRHAVTRPNHQTKAQATLARERRASTPWAG